MDIVLNKGLNFCILPLKLDMTQVFTDFRKFERSIIWHEFWFGRDEDNNKEEPIFKRQKTNMPKGHTTPEDLKVFLSSVKSELSDPRNRNKEGCNLPVNEINALKELIKLQKERVIIIKACDKGARIMILSKTESNRSYYSKVEPCEVERTKKKIGQVLKEGLEDKITSKEEHGAMVANDQNPGWFYRKF